MVRSGSSSGHGLRAVVSQVEVDDPVIALERQLGRRLERVREQLDTMWHQPSWLPGGYARKQARLLHPTTLLRYLEDLKVFALDPATLSVPEIEKRLAT